MRITELQKIEAARQAVLDETNRAQEPFASLLNRSDFRSWTNTVPAGNFFTVDGDVVSLVQIAKFGPNGFVLHYKPGQGCTLFFREGNVAFEAIDIHTVTENTAEKVSDLVEEELKEDEPKKRRRRSPETAE